jgi:hypothetical protein
MGPQGAEGQVEVGWPEARVAIYYDDERRAAERLREAGWAVFRGEAQLSLEELLQALERGG